MAPWDQPRDPARIDPVLDELRSYWEQNPDLRLGQIVVNAARVLDLDPFNIEEHRLVEGIHALSRDAREQ